MRKRLKVCAAAGVLVLAGCGGGDGTSATETDSSSGSGGGSGTSSGTTAGSCGYGTAARLYRSGTSSETGGAYSSTTTDQKAPGASEFLCVRRLGELAVG